MSGLVLHVVNKGTTENGEQLKVGMEAEYIGHLPGGMVSIRLFLKKDIAHPLCFKEFQ